MYRRTRHRHRRRSVESRRVSPGKSPRQSRLVARTTSSLFPHEPEPQRPSFLPPFLPPSFVILRWNLQRGTACRATDAPCWVLLGQWGTTVA